MTIHSVSNNPYQAYTGIQPVMRPAGPVAADPQKHRPEAISNVPGDQTSRTSGNEPSDPLAHEAQSKTPRHHPDEFTAAEKALLDSLKQADQQVRRHEMAHVAVGGRYITSGANFSYKRGPDGINYAVAGEVSIDTAPVPGDPKATIAKMRQVKQAALAPADPSPQDIKVASMATSLATKAMAEMTLQQAREQARQNETKAFSSHQSTADAYARVKNLPEQEMSSFKIAV